MGKAHKKTSGEIGPDEHTLPEGPVSMAALINEPASALGLLAGSEPKVLDAGSNQPQREATEDESPADERRTYRSRPDPFAIATINTPSNRLHLGKSDRLKAFLIRFDSNPNERRDKTDPHPVIALLKEAGYKYREIPGDGMAWQKPWDGEYRIREEMDARDMARKAAEVMGAKIEYGISR